MDTPPKKPLPTSAEFRAWVQNGLAKVGLSASGVARELGLGRNTLSGFLADPERSITLDNAQAVAGLIRVKAQSKGVALPPVEGGQDAR
ncbi:helix-turn-helix domain-containing protein [Sulfitobacter sp. 1A16787]|uniref:helix-turn-helix domain-containing protein n=1 Tax=Sulfitobacter sp. 1A16787 TaxID=3368571 RepID=UPI00374675AD